jgi:sulfopyruvate decarboxylase subunit beta
MKRYDAIKVIVECLKDEYVVACNGMISRELFAIKDKPTNFYMLGSMGLGSAIGLGITLAKSNKKVIVLSGDGNLLMSLGTLATIGKVAPKNFIQIVLDNECHESTGGQETASANTKFSEIATNSGFAYSKSVDSIDNLKNVLISFLGFDGPSLINVKISKERVDVCRLSAEPTEIKERFTKELAKKD